MFKSQSKLTCFYWYFFVIVLKLNSEIIQLHILIYCDRAVNHPNRMVTFYFLNPLVYVNTANSSVLALTVVFELGEEDDVSEVCMF